MAADSSSPTKRESTSPTENKDVTRLHITPLDRDLLKVIVPASVLPHARNISLHTIETFPEKRYGYVDLPAPEAEKLRKRLNGTTFKGLKMRVEKARPEDRSWEVVSGKQTEERTAEEEKGMKKKKKEKRKAADEAETQGGSSKRRRDTLNVVEGYLLTDRKVKRGWTESTDTKVKNKRSSKDKDHRTREDEKERGKEKEKQKRKRLRSKYTDRDECLLKTRVPPNAVANLVVGSEAHRTMMAKSGKKKQKNQDGGGCDVRAREVIVHEFERTTTFPSFLKHVVPERQGKEAVEFVDGRGWVDEDGNLVEAVEMKTRMGTGRTDPGKKTEREREMRESSSDDDDSTSSSGTSSEEDSESDADPESKPPKNMTAAQSKESRPSNQDSTTTSAARPSSSSSSSPSPAPANNSHNPRPISSSSSRSLTIKIPTLPPTTPIPPVPQPPPHPLEALYKRPKPDNASTAASAPATSFSFFSNDHDQGEPGPDDDEDTDAPAPVPMTPFTRQDFEWRNVRSAAPTPDTAHPARARNLWGPTDEEDDGQDDDDEQQEGHDEDPARPDGQQDTSDFQSWFWANRRSLNQAWMTRRKTAAKEKRHRENKSRASKAI